MLHIIAHKNLSPSALLSWLWDGYFWIVILILVSCHSTV